MFTHNEGTLKSNNQCNSSNDKEGGLLKKLENTAIPGSKAIAVNINIKKSHFSRSGENIGEEIKIQIKYPVPVHYPATTASKSDKEKAQIRLEEDLNEFGLLSEENSLKVLRAIAIPTLIAEAVELLSPVGRLSCTFSGIMWIIDDLFNKLLNGNVAPESETNKIAILRFADNCQDIIEGKEVSSNCSYTGCPKKDRMLQTIQLSFYAVVNGIKELNPDYYNVQAHRLRFLTTLREYFLSSVWFNEDYSNNGQTISNSCALFFRKMSSGAYCTIEYFALVKGYYLENKIRQEPLFKAALDSAIAIATQVNDLLGILKEFKANDAENSLCHMLRKGTSIEKVAEYIEGELSERCLDYSLLSNRLRGIYANNENLLNYLTIVDGFIVAQLPWYLASTRYLSNSKWENDILHFKI